MPYIRNVSMEETITSLFDGIHASLVELHKMIPLDPNVLNWNECFDRVHGTERQEYEKALRWV